MASVRPFTERDGNMPIHRGKTMKLLLDTIVLRPYVFAFFLAFLLAGRGDLGWRRTLFFGAWVWPLAWLAEFASTRIGVPFGLYHYTGTTRGQEVYVDNVPLMDSLSFTFLAYAAFCLARVVLAGRAVSRVRLAIVSGLLMMLLDVVIDPLAVRGGRWFLGYIFYYPEGGVYFGVPLTNFAGWWIVGALGVGGWLWVLSDPHARWGRGARPGGGVYYGLVPFNIVLTGWIGEGVLAALGFGLAVALAVGGGRFPRAGA